MNENDKILITAYLDGETSNDETIYIESLLESNKEAHEYANNIKRANAEISSNMLDTSPILNHFIS